MRSRHCMRISVSNLHETTYCSKAAWWIWCIFDSISSISSPDRFRKCLASLDVFFVWTFCVVYKMIETVMWIRSWHRLHNRSWYDKSFYMVLWSNPGLRVSFCKIGTANVWHVLPQLWCRQARNLRFLHYLLHFDRVQVRIAKIVTNMSVLIWSRTSVDWMVFVNLVFNEMEKKFLEIQRILRTNSTIESTSGTDLLKI